MCFHRKKRFNQIILWGITKSLLCAQNTHTQKSIARIVPSKIQLSTMSGNSWMDNHLLEMVIIIRLLCVSTGAIPEKLALHEFIDWLQTKGSLYSRQDIIQLNRFSVETHPFCGVWFWSICWRRDTSGNTAEHYVMWSSGTSRKSGEKRNPYLLFSIVLRIFQLL